jgi:hypothetical protein
LNENFALPQKTHRRSNAPTLITSLDWSWIIILLRMQKGMNINNIIAIWDVKYITWIWTSDAKEREIDDAIILYIIITQKYHRPADRFQRIVVASFTFWYDFRLPLFFRIGERRLTVSFTKPWNGRYLYRLNVETEWNHSGLKSIYELRSCQLWIHGDWCCRSIDEQMMHSCARAVRFGIIAATLRMP